MLSLSKFARVLRLCPQLFKNSTQQLVWDQSLVVVQTQNYSIYNKYACSFSQAQQVALDLEENDLGNYKISQKTIDALKKNGISKLFPIQYLTFNDIYNGKDLLASDRTGSGKTLAYSLPIIEKLKASQKTKGFKFLVLCPTRELAIQVTDQIKKITQRDLDVVTIYGGAPIDRQLSQLRENVSIIVATPGRLIDMIERKAVNLSELEYVCIDQADTMLQKGFKLDVENIFESIKKQNSKKTQNIMFSATIPPWVEKIASQHFSSDKIVLSLIKENSVKTSQTVDHYAFQVAADERHECVKNLIQKYNPNQRTIIFTRTKHQANYFIKHFDNNEICVLHGDISQNERENNIKMFKSGKRKILVATDVASRGLDIPNVQLVIQLSPPENPEPFIHRSGRTGRAGKTGINVILFDHTNIHYLREIERETQIELKVIEDFNMKVIKNNSSFFKDLKTVVDEVKSQSKNDKFNPYTSTINELLSNSSPQEIISKFLKKYGPKLPTIKSFITGEEGLMSFQTELKGSKILAELFPGVVILNFKESNSGSTFDVKFEQVQILEREIKNKKLENKVSELEQEIEFKKLKDVSISRHRSHDRGQSNSYNRHERNNQGERDNWKQSKSSSRYDNKQSGDRKWSNKSTRNQDNEDEDFQFEGRRETRQPREPRQNRRSGTDQITSFKVFVSGLQPDITEQDLSSAFVNAGIEPTSVQVRSSKDKSKGTNNFAFVQFKSKEDTVSALSKRVMLRENEYLNCRAAKDNN